MRPATCERASWSSVWKLFELGRFLTISAQSLGEKPTFNKCLTISACGAVSCCMELQKLPATWDCRSCFTSEISESSCSTLEDGARLAAFSEGAAGAAGLVLDRVGNCAGWITSSWGWYTWGSCRAWLCLRFLFCSASAIEMGVMAASFERAPRLIGRTVSAATLLFKLAALSSSKRDSVLSLRKSRPASRFSSRNASEELLAAGFPESFDILERSSGVMARISTPWSVSLVDSTIASGPILALTILRASAVLEAVNFCGPMIDSV